VIVNPLSHSARLPDPLPDQGLQVPARGQLAQQLAVAAGEQTVRVSRRPARTPDSDVTTRSLLPPPSPRLHRALLLPHGRVRQTQSPGGQRAAQREQEEQLHGAGAQEHGSAPEAGNTVNTGRTRRSTHREDPPLHPPGGPAGPPTAWTAQLTEEPLGAPVPGGSGSERSFRTCA